MALLIDTHDDLVAVCLQSLETLSESEVHTMDNTMQYSFTIYILNTNEKSIQIFFSGDILILMKLIDCPGHGGKVSFFLQVCIINFLHRKLSVQFHPNYVAPAVRHY